MGESSIERKSVLAGILISMGCLFSMAAKPYGPVVQGLCFSVGLFGVLCCKANLFTGKVLMVQHVWDGRETLDAFVGWSAIFWTFNMFGALCVALMASQLGFDAMEIARAKAGMPWHELLIRAVLCNVMVCMAVHVVNRASVCTMVDVMAACLLPVACFVACGYEHSVADMLYMPLGAINGAVGAFDCVRVILLATVGNIIGGVAFSRMTWEGK